jgi:RNA polymerase sigma-70 factor (ECF subfamily)
LVVSLNDREIGSEIVASCRLGGREAFRSLYEAYKDRVYSIALYFFHGDAAAAGDATQQVFVKLMMHIAKFRGDSDFATWLYRMVVNVCLDGVRRSRRETPFEEQPPRLAAIGSHEDNLARGETADSVRRAVSSLPPKLRLPILLRYFDELSYAQMAEALHCSMGTAASRLSRGHRLLAEKLGPLRGSPTYSEAGLDAARTRQVNQHLERCALCRDELEKIRFAAGFAGQLPLAKAPESVWKRIEAELDQSTGQVTRVWIPGRLEGQKLFGNPTLERARREISAKVNYGSCVQ